MKTNTILVLALVLAAVAAALLWKARPAKPVTTTTGANPVINQPSQTDAVAAQIQNGANIVFGLWDRLKGSASDSGYADL